MEAARVGDHGDAPLDAGRQHVFELAQERARVAAAALTRLVQDVHGQLGEPVARQHVDRPTLDHVAGGGGAVAEEPAAVGDPQQLRRPAGRAHGGSTATRRSLTSTCWPDVPWIAATVPAPFARKVCSIFIASSTTRPSPSATVWPTVTRTLVMVPGNGARHSPATPPRSSASSSARRAKVDWPSGPFTSARCAECRTR